MDRVHFLDAQLWMRRATASDWNSKSNDTTSTLLLPPPAPDAAQAHGSAVAAAREAMAWCCFHVGARYCVFRAGDAGEDQTQFQFEIVMRKQRKECQLLLRFDGQHVYTVDLDQVVSTIYPKPTTSSPNGAQPVTQQRQQQDAPPFGSIEFQNVSLRVWLDLPHGSSSVARQLVHHALVGVQHCMMKARGRKPARPTGIEGDQKPSWQDAFRHSEWLVSRKAASGGAETSHNGLTALQTTPSAFFKRARRILRKDADFEAVKVTCWKIFRSTRSFPRRRRTRSEGEDAQAHGAGGPGSENDGDDAHSTRLSEMDLLLLLTELAHIFGEEHDGVNELLGFTPSAACLAHDRCYELRHERLESGGAEPFAPSTCVASKWQAWDEYLEVSAQVLGQRSRRIEDEPKSIEDKHATVYAAAAVFQRALVDDEDVAVWQQRTQMQRDQINSFERVGLSACFPDRSKRRRTQEPQVVDVRHVQQQLQAEQMFAVLLEKRKQLVRDELALSLLPRCAPPLAAPSAADAM